MTQNNGTQTSLVKAFQLIEYLQDGELGLIELSNISSMNKTTVHRILNTMIQLGYIKQNPDNSKYQLTLKFLEIGNKIIDKIDIISLSKPFLKELSADVNEVVHLVVIDGDNIVYIDKIESTNTIRMHSYIGKRIPLMCTAVGKSYIAELEPTDKKKYIDSINFADFNFTPHSIKNKDEYVKTLDKYKLQGFYLDKEEFEMGVTCVAAPIFDHVGNVKYAISVSTPTIRISDDKIQAFGEKVKLVADEISHECGYRK